MTDIAAILLAGGRGSRMGGVRKPLLEVHGKTLLDAAIDAARGAGCESIVIAADPITGPGAPKGDVKWVREDPPYGGPAAAIVAALPLVEASCTLILACDLPRVDDAVRMLSASPFDGDGVCLADAAGGAQWLIGTYRTDALRAAAATLSDRGRDVPVRALLGGLRLTTVVASEVMATDIDTWDDLNNARRRNP
jgi:molybdopterin-guanine dinucleotide biosynthesis protein A